MRLQIFTQICFLWLFPVILFSQDVLVTTGTNVTIESGWKVKITNGGDLTIQDDATGAGSLIDRNSTNQVNFTGGGEAKVQLFLVDDDWHYLASPVDSALSGAFWDIYLKQFAEPDSSWSYITSPDSVLNPFQGYAAWVSSSYTSDTTVTFDGNLNAGTYSSILKNTGNGSHASKGFNFMGNPYPCAIDWQVGSSGWTRTNLDPTIYLWNATNGQYGTYNRNTKVGTNAVDSIIPSKQGFFVHVSTSGSGTLAVNNNARVHHHKAFFKSVSKISIPESLDLIVTGNGMQDETVILFNENATEGFDNEYEAFKIQGKYAAPQLYTTAEEIPLAVNALKEISPGLSVPLNFTAGVSGAYTLSVENLESFDINQVILLEDLLDNTIQDLKQNQTYIFSSSPEDDSARFVIHFYQITGMDEINTTTSVHIYAYDKTVFINIPFETTGTIEVFNILGQSVLKSHARQGLNKVPLYEYNGHYIVRLNCNNGTKSKKVYIN